MGWSIDHLLPTHIPATENAMKLYITPGSPYARIVRIVILEKGLQDRVEIVAAQTRRASSPYYEINPSGRVPYLVRDDGVGMEESALICDYLDGLSGRSGPDFRVQSGDWAVRRLEAIARSMIDGLAVWSRETGRPQGEQSPTVIAHERARSERMADLWQREIDHPWLHGPLNMAQITLGCALGMEARIPDFRWRDGRAKLSKWYEPIAARPSFEATVPVERH
jgi:glutathione S-transferase